jgi:hypothetical protein
MSLVYAKKSDEIGCVCHVFLHTCAASGTVNLDAEEHQNRVATLCTRVYLPCARVQDSLLRFLRYST